MQVSEVIEMEPGWFLKLESVTADISVYLTIWSIIFHILGQFDELGRSFSYFNDRPKEGRGVNESVGVAEPSVSPALDWTMSLTPWR